MIGGSLGDLGRSEMIGGDWEMNGGDWGGIRDDDTKVVRIVHP